MPNPSLSYGKCSCASPYLLQGSDGGALPSIVGVPVHVENLLPIHRHDPRQNTFLDNAVDKSTFTVMSFTTFLQTECTFISMKWDVSVLRVSVQKRTEGGCTREGLHEQRRRACASRCAVNII